MSATAPLLAAASRSVGKLFWLAAFLLLSAWGCNPGEGGSSHDVDLSGTWTGTYSSNFNESGDLKIVFTRTGSGAYDVGLHVTGPSCSLSAGDDGFGSASGFAFGDSVQFSVAFVECTDAFGALFAGGIFAFSGTAGGNQITGTYTRQSDRCSCCQCSGFGISGTWVASH